MLILDDILGAPMKGVMWVLKEVAAAADQEMRAEGDRIREQLRELYQQLEQRRITQALQRTRGKRKAAAELLRMPLRTFTLKLKQYGLGGIESFENIFLGHVEMCGDLLDGRGAAQFLREVRSRPGDRQPELLEAAGDTHRPSLVPEVPFDLAEHGGRGVGRELHAPVGVEPVHGLDQADGADLHQIVVGFAAIPESAGQVVHQRQVHGHEFVADGSTRRVVLVECREPGQQLVLVGAVGLAPAAAARSRDG